MRRWILAAVVAAALLVVGLVALLGGDADSGERAQGPATKTYDIAGVAETEQLLKGIPQDGMSLGWPSAPVTLLEYVDLQCPFCKQHQLDVQPTLIRELVRTKQAQIAFVPLAFLGSDSVGARNVFMRMAQTNKAWDFANLFFWNQGQENSGYVTDAFLQDLVAAIPGTTPADASKKLDKDLAQVTIQRDILGQRVLGGHKSGTPGFSVGPTNGDPLKFRWIEMYQDKPDAEELITAVRKAARELKQSSPTPSVGATA